MNFPLLRRLPVLALLLTLVFPSMAQAATLNVPSAAYPTIQSAINAASNGDTVLVGDGTYTGPGNVDIDFDGKSLTVKSVNGAAKTIINCGGYASADGSGNHRGFYIHSGEVNAIINGFAVKNGYEAFISTIPDSGDGGGVYIGNSSSKGTITLTNCTVSGNTASYGGGGVYNENDNENDNSSGSGSATITLTNCTVSGNTASYGGGVYNYNYNNSSSGSATITLTNCTVSGNTASNGGGGGVYNFNYSSSSSGGATITLTNDILYGDTGSETSTYGGGIAISYCDIQGGSPISGTGNIDKDPLFVRNPNLAATPTDYGDLHLKPSSPCLGAGTPNVAPATDLDGNPRPNPPSMGAYELAAAPATIKITLAHMVSASKLSVSTARSFGSNTLPVSVSLNIDGTMYTATPILLGSDKTGSADPTPIVINLGQISDAKGNHVPRFTKNEAIQVTVLAALPSNSTIRTADR